MANVSVNLRTNEVWEREEGHYLDPASDLYAAQLAAVVFGWGTWELSSDSGACADRGSRDEARDRLEE